MSLTAAARARQARERARDLLRSPAARVAREERTDEETCRAVLGSLGASGLLRYTVPAAFGGTAAVVEVSAIAAVREELAYESGLLDLLFAMQGLGSFPVTLAGSESWKRRALPKVASGEWAAAFAVTEPGAGSDLSMIRTRAVREGAGYEIRGTKCFISNAPFADLITVVATTRPEAGRKGLTAFVVQGGPEGPRARSDIELIAPHPIGTLEFDGLFVPEENRLGAEGDGFGIAMAALDRFRPTVGAAAVGFARRGLDEALAHARQRVQFGRPIAEFEGIQFKLAEMATKLEAATLLVEAAAAACDRGKDGPTPRPLSPLGEEPTRQASMAKLFATEAAQEIIDEAVQIHGGRGLARGAIVERLYREIRALRIYEGTSEIQRSVIARSLIKR